MSDPRLELLNKTVKELRAIAGAKGIPRATKLKKDELVEAILERQQAASALPKSTPPVPAPAKAAPSSSGTSGQGAPRPAAPLPPPEQGLPIPDRYGRDRLVLLVQDPHHLFAYWEVTPGTLAQVRARAGEGSSPVLILLTAQGQEVREIDLIGGNYYLAVAPQSTYRANLALRDRQGRIHVFCESNEVTTPSAGPSWRTDETWMAVNETFQELLKLAGLPGQQGASSGARFSAERFRQRSLDQRILAWDWREAIERAGVEVGAQGPISSAALAQAAIALVGQSSHLLSSAARLLPLGVSSGQLLSSGALSSFSLSSHSLSSAAISSGAILAAHGIPSPPPGAAPQPAAGVAPERRLIDQPAAVVAQGGHAQANAPLAAVLAEPLPPPAPAPAPAVPAPTATIGRLRGADTVKREGRKPLPPRARR